MPTGKKDGHSIHIKIKKKDLMYNNTTTLLISRFANIAFIF